MVQRTARRHFVSQTRTRAIGVDTGRADERLSILTSLSKFAQAGSEEANRQQRAEIETKKALGASRAAQDLLLAEQNRQGITDDDVLATKVAYNAIVGKHETMEAGNEFTEWYKLNPEADEQTIEAKKAELYQPLFEKYGGDNASLKQLSLDVQQSQYSLLNVQESIRQGHMKMKGEEALTISIGDLLADPNADLPDIIDSEIPERAKVLGLTEFEYKKALMSEMTTRAADGDNRLLEQLRTTDWAKNSVLIDKASSAFDKFTARENAIQIGDQLGTIEIQNSKLEVPWETTLRQVERLNKQFPNSISAAKIAQMKKARASAVKVQKNNTDIMQSSWKNLFSEESLPLALNGKYSAKEKQTFIKELDTIFATKTQELIDGGMDENTANSVMMKQRLDWSRVNRIKVPLLEQNLKGLLSLNPEDYPRSQDLPKYATDGLSVLQQMDEQTLSLYFPSRNDMTFARNIKDAMSTREPYAAFKRAVNIKQNPFKVTSEVRTEVNSEVTAQVEDALNHNWFYNAFGKKDAPDWQVAQITSRVSDIAMTNMYNGMLDPEGNAKQSVAEGMKDLSPTFNGTMINVNRAQFSDTTGVPTSKIDDYIEAFVLSNEANITAEVGEEVDPEDISLDFAQNGTFILRLRGGEQIGGRFTYDDIKSAGEGDVIKQLSELREQAAEARRSRAETKAKFESAEAAHMAAFYEEWGN